MLPEEIDSVWIWLKALKKGEIIRKKKLLLIKKEVNTHLNSPQRQAPLQKEEEEEVGEKKNEFSYFFEKMVTEAARESPRLRLRHCCGCGFKLNIIYVIW